MNLEQKEWDRLIEILKPFLKTAKGIPENWPEQCSLYYELRLSYKDEEYPVINYHSANHDAGPKIGDYRNLEEWLMGKN